ncbi:ribonuclease H-like domain-containing protein [Tanacetum coccineum]|uniref:Ribonuclease H-like domain-containing protein n=1 Tax=Tanacetum coccineum TaxID=301880 RepID=A0ABQ5CGW8_9ASTR
MPPQRRFILAAPPPGCDVAESSTAARAPRAADRAENVGYVRALQASKHRMMTSIEEVNLRVIYQAQRCNDDAVQQMKRDPELEARAQIDTVEDTGSSFLEDKEGKQNLDRRRISKAFVGQLKRRRSGLLTNHSDYPHRALKNKGIVDSGCSRHMTGNKAYLDEFQDFNGGPVAFGGIEGYNHCKGKIKTGKLRFEWIFHLERLVPSRGLACLIAKATTDESNKWHRRLGHVNFKNLNKLVKGNLQRLTFQRLFKKDHTLLHVVRKESNTRPPVRPKQTEPKDLIALIPDDVKSVLVGKFFLKNLV